MQKIATEADVATVLAEPLAVVYKHSPICPTSGLAYEEIRSLRRLQQDVPVYMVDVVHSRAISRYIAERVGVVHASPQAIILRAGVPAWHGSHYDLQAETMARTLQALKGTASESSLRDEGDMG
ncbi:MAG TPA: bacillithiol system redox-active protein YtxJ [Gemmatimonadales bacterium]|jgi:bacillithiol system protein YtxJ|nr:bacillithiol system redox-active protein YtxJ [Gemmatimonadales bacterium]